MRRFQQNKNRKKLRQLDHVFDTAPKVGRELQRSVLVCFIEKVDCVCKKRHVQYMQRMTAVEYSGIFNTHPNVRDLLST